jgi:hypothetical protein
MISLYFNCKLTHESVALGKITTRYNYPVTYPKKIESSEFSQYEVLIATIKSYSIFKFDIVIFNIDIDSRTDEVEEEIKNIILNTYTANKIILNFSRPSTVEGWLKNVTEASSLIKKNSPVLVVMNHDHPFIDYTQNLFIDLIKIIFPEKNNNFGKAFYYSHAPEVISWAVNGRHSLRFKKQSDGLFKSDKMNNWIDSICIMTMDTLENIWMRAKFDGTYIGRFDWENVSYSNLGIEFYLFPREFFKHFDGYGHITGIRLISEFKSTLSPVLYFPSSASINELANFYYQRWIDCFVITVREQLRESDSSGKSKKYIFVNSIEETLDLFKIGYLNADVKSGLMREDQISVVESKLRSHIYYMANSLYDIIKSDMELTEEIKPKERYLFIKKNAPSFLIKLGRKIRKIIMNRISN